MALTISNIGSVLKKIIIPTIQNQLPKDSVLFDKIKKNSGVTISNNNVYISAKTGRHSGIYNVAEGNEPYAGKAKYENPYTGLKYAFGTLELTDQAIAATNESNGDVKAIASILNEEITSLKEDIRMDTNRQMQGNGTGILCTTNGTGVAGTTVIVDGNPNGGDATEYLTDGMYIHIGTGAAVAITSVASATTFTLAANSWSDGEVICKGTGTTTPGTAGSSVEIMGLAGLIDDGDNLATVQNILRSSYPWTVSHTEDTSTGLTEAQMIAIYLKCKRYGGKKVLFAGPTLYQRYGQLLTSMKRTANTTEILSGGWKGLEFMADSGIMLDYDVWDGYVQFVDFDSLTIAEMSTPFAWLEADAHGGILGRSSSNRTIWEGTLKYYFQLIAKKFKTMGRLSGKTVDA